MKAAVKVKNLTKSFGKEKVLKGISHTFEAGKIHGIMGFNGSGKTVMFKCICGFLQPDRGSVYVYGKRIGKDIDFPENTGMIIESPGFLPYISGYENLKRLAQLNRKIGDTEIRDAIARVGLDPFSKKKVGQNPYLFRWHETAPWNCTGDHGAAKIINFRRTIQWIG